MHAATNIRTAASADVDQVATLVNRAYEVERFFVDGDRTRPDDVLQSLGRGTFLIGTQADGSLAGTVFVELLPGRRASFGMLAVDPRYQGQGWGSRLIQAAEQHARAAGAVTMEIRVVNLREDLLARYGRLGYVEVGVEPYVHRPVTRACHFIKMEKTL